MQNNLTKNDFVPVSYSDLEYDRKDGSIFYFTGFEYLGKFNVEELRYIEIKIQSYLLNPTKTFKMFIQFKESPDLNITVDCEYSAKMIYEDLKCQFNYFK